MKAKEDTDVSIIRLLKEAPDTHISGSALSRALGISRTAVWKHIKGLRKAGYPVEASPSKGYRLAPRDAASNGAFNGIEVLSGLSTSFIGRRVFFFDTLDSTNIKALELGRKGEPEGTAVIADKQTMGKGRLGRRWESPPGVNLYTSVILRPGIPPADAQRLTLLMAVAAAEAVGIFTKESPSVKWPNDILIGSKKVAGILMEMDAEPDRVNFVVAGIGVNINMKEADLPDSLRQTASSIMQSAGKEVARAAVTQGLYSSIEKWYKIFLATGFSPVINEWKRYFAFEGKAVRVSVFNRTVEGICLGIDDDGALLVKTASGVIERVISGDVEAGQISRGLD